MLPKAILGFDIDGTLTRRNTENILPDGLAVLLNELDNLGYYSVPVTGKPSTYALRIINSNGLKQRGIVAENAGVYIKPNNIKPQVYGLNIAAIFKLKQILGLKPEEKGVTKIFLNGEQTETVVDPEDVSIFTIFTNADAVKHKWAYEPSMTTKEVFNHLTKIIKQHRLDEKLLLLPPFPDGGIQVIRMKKDGKNAIDKSSLLEVLSLIYQTKKALPVAMFGDGHNDIPAMSPKNVIPITFNNSEGVVKDYVQKKKGFISSLDAPEDIGVVDGIAWLNNNNFFENDKLKVEELIKYTFPEFVPSW